MRSTGEYRWTDAKGRTNGRKAAEALAFYAFLVFYAVGQNKPIGGKEFNRKERKERREEGVTIVAHRFRAFAH